MQKAEVAPLALAAQRDTASPSAPQRPARGRRSRAPQAQRPAHNALRSDPHSVSATLRAPLGVAHSHAHARTPHIHRLTHASTHTHQHTHCTQTATTARAFAPDINWTLDHSCHATGGGAPQRRPRFTLASRHAPGPRTITSRLWTAPLTNLCTPPQRRRAALRNTARRVRSSGGLLVRAPYAPLSPSIPLRQGLPSPRRPLPTPAWGAPRWRHAVRSGLPSRRPPPPRAACCIHLHSPSLALPIPTHLSAPSPVLPVQTSPSTLSRPPLALAIAKRGARSGALRLSGARTHARTHARTRTHTHTHTHTNTRIREAPRGFPPRGSPVFLRDIETSGVWAASAVAGAVAASPGSFPSLLCLSPSPAAAPPRARVPLTRPGDCSRDLGLLKPAAHVAAVAIAAGDRLAVGIEVAAAPVLAWHQA